MIIKFINLIKNSDEQNSDAEESENPHELKVGSLRKNIREVMDETKLDEATLAAQMQEKERLRRVQEQLRANRDVSFAKLHSSTTFLILN